MPSTDTSAPAIAEARELIERAAALLEIDEESRGWVLTALLRAWDEPDDVTKFCAAGAVLRTDDPFYVRLAALVERADAAIGEGDLIQTESMWQMLRNAAWLHTEVDIYAHEHAGAYDQLP